MDFSSIPAKLVFNLIKIGLAAGLVGAIYFGIMNHGKRLEENKNLKVQTKIMEQRDEVKNEVHAITNRVAVDGKYRQRVRQQFDTGFPE